MRKFKIRYYELELNEVGQQFKRVKESIIKANNFTINNGFVVFEHDNFKNIALYDSIVSVEEVIEEGE